MKPIEVVIGLCLSTFAVIVLVWLIGTDYRFPW